MSSIIALAMENILYLLLFPLSLSPSTPTPSSVCHPRVPCSVHVSTLSLPSPVCVCARGESTKCVAAIWITVERTRAATHSPVLFIPSYYYYFFFLSFGRFCFFHFVRSFVDGVSSARASAAASRFNIICAEKFGVKRNRGVAWHIEDEWSTKKRRKRKISSFRSNTTCTVCDEFFWGWALRRK